ncbi:MAG: aminoacetone oxidase family FAD-binding enzyme [Cytophagales bacterium]|nr:aminoacetone oxidase family FAD-binding enzyme [Armatimonadota bacterium]
MTTDWTRGVVVVGGGAAGMIAAHTAAMRGVPTLLLEKKNRLGTKILISGGGKCNVAHAGPMEEVRARFRPNEARFLQPSFYRFTNDDFIRMLSNKGMETYTRPDGRIFPVAPADAKDVVSVLEAHLSEAGVRIRLEAAVTEIETTGGGVSGVLLASGDRIETRCLIVAAGGSSYPATGTTGDGWRWLEALGHHLVPLRAALAPLYLEPTPPAEWSGVALRDCLLRARRINADNTPGKELMRWRGDLLWTHKGLSGPTALGVSREVAETIPEQSGVEVDLLPGEPFEALRERLLEQTKAFPRRSVADFIEQIVPNRLVKPVFDTAQVEPTVKGAYLGAKERSRLVQTLKGWSLGRVRHVPLERGEVVAGGVTLSEVDPRTMRSQRVRGLYLCGEVLDIAGPVGGYNLQAAWSTGFVAGEAAAKEQEGSASSPDKTAGFASSRFG